MKDTIKRTINFRFDRYEETEIKLIISKDV